MSALRDIARLRSLAPAERRLLSRALILYCSYAGGVRFAGLRRARNWFAGLPPIDGVDERRAVRMVSAVELRLRVVGGCLPAALTLNRVLEAQRIACELRIGVRKVRGRVEAHAWIERDGVSLFDTRGPGEEFAALEPAKASR